MRPLTEIEGCFQGVIPSYIATASAEREPNVTAVSIVHLLGPERVGVSCQFMNKTLANLQATGRARIAVIDPVTLAEYLLEASFDRLMESGPVFERMDATLHGIASQSGMSSVFALSGVVELSVQDWQAASGRAEPDGKRAASASPLEQVERISAVMAAATDVDGLLEDVFAAFETHLGLRHGFLLLADGSGTELYTLASRGFEQARFGAEIAMGEGIYGTAAARKIPIRTGSMRRERLMSAAVAREIEQPDPTSLPLPGLADAESSLAVPLVHVDRCIGVLCFQSPDPGAFSAACETTVVIVARHLAAMITLLGAPAKEVEVSAKRGPLGARALATRVKYFESDGSVFVDDDYLIKGVAGRILWRVLSNYVNDHRDEFSSKEIRLDSEVGLPALKDNLETRLIALRRRLDERGGLIRIEKTGRGRFRVELSRELVLERRP